MLEKKDKIEVLLMLNNGDCFCINDVIFIADSFEINNDYVSFYKRKSFSTENGKDFYKEYVAKIFIYSIHKIDCIEV